MSMHTFLWFHVQNSKVNESVDCLLTPFSSSVILDKILNLFDLCNCDEVRKSMVLTLHSCSKKGYCGDGKKIECMDFTNIIKLYQTPKKVDFKGRKNL